MKREDGELIWDSRIFPRKEINMTSLQLFEAISWVDEKYILEAADYKSVIHLKTIKKSIIAAAVVAAVIGIVLTIMKTMNEPATDFEIENGVLVAYNGNDTEVVIPEEVRAISGNAFNRSSSSSNASSITKLTIGANVEEIGDLTFANLKNLEKVELSPYNQWFEYDDGVLVSKNGSVAFLNIGSYYDSQADFKKMDALQKIITNNGLSSLESIVIGNGVFRTFVRSGEGDYYSIEVLEVTSRGKLYHMEKNENGHFPVITGNQKFQAFDTEQAFCTVFQGTAYFFSNYGVSIVELDSSSDEGRFLLSVYCESNKLLYSKTPYKWHRVSSETIMPRILFVFDREELYCEFGEIVFDTSGIKYKQTEKQTVSDVFNLEMEFEDWKKNSLSQGSLHEEYVEDWIKRTGKDYSEFSLDDLIEENISLNKWIEN